MDQRKKYKSTEKNMDQRKKNPDQRKNMDQRKKYGSTEKYGPTKKIRVNEIIINQRKQIRIRDYTQTRTNEFIQL